MVWTASLNANIPPAASVPWYPSTLGFPSRREMMRYWPLNPEGEHLHGVPIPPDVRVIDIPITSEKNLPGRWSMARPQVYDDEAPNPESIASARSALRLGKYKNLLEPLKSLVSIDNGPVDFFGGKIKAADIEKDML
eukprot:GEMP01094828.1.p1 GENE.GEMP01094828.1~~GEMP01094828.1.p1  ORF type:complete len:137 (+),score=25.07 GEMP01094828.1:98-508(+)